MTTKAESLLKTFVVTIDGPAGSGKSTTAREVARRLRLIHLDTGAMYRAVTLRALREGADLEDGDVVGAIAETAAIEFAERDAAPQQVLLDGEDVTDAIRGDDVTASVSTVSKHQRVRKAMVRRQRRLADGGGVLLEGRDTGSVVVPWADVKIYLDASSAVRAQRRALEHESRGEGAVDVAAVQVDIERRDELDRGREVSPLKVPVGAVVIDTSGHTVESQVETVVAAVNETAARLSDIWVPKGRNPAQKRPWWWRANQMIAAILVHGLWGIKIVRKEKREFNENYIYASNHRSTADPPAVAAVLKRPVYFVAKEALFKNPVFGALIRSYRAVPIRRGAFDRTAMNLFADKLSNGGSVLIFPEGGRMMTEELGSPKAGVGHLALRSGAAIMPVYVLGTANLFQSLFRRPRLTIIEGKPIRVDGITLNDNPDRDLARDLSEMVMAAIGALQDEILHGS